MAIHVTLRDGNTGDDLPHPMRLAEAPNVGDVVNHMDTLYQIHYRIWEGQGMTLVVIPMDTE